MKNLFLLLAAILLISCGKKKDAELIEHYKSQPRDANLVGWWISKSNNDSVFFNYQSSGEALQGKYENNKYVTINEDYWYTKDSCFYFLEVNSGALYKSVEYKSKYKIADDSLWMSDNLNAGGSDSLELLGVEKKGCRTYRTL